MTELCTDPASEVITVVMDALKAVYAASAECPPLGGAATEVTFFAGDAAYLDEVDCANPLLWVRLMSRHRSEVFPEPSPVVSPCGALDVIEVEIGVARCADRDPSFRASESEIALDDTWRLSKAMCLVSGQLGTDHFVGSDPIVPYGPEGGIIAWTSTLYISV